MSNFPYIQERLNLTFGVEFEFIVRVPVARYSPAMLQLRTTKYPSNQNLCQLKVVQYHMVQVLRSAGVAVNDAYLNQATSNWTFVPAGDGRGSFIFDEKDPTSDDIYAWSPAQFDRWAVETDRTIDFRGQEANPVKSDEFEVGIELKTRKLHLDSAGLDEVSHVLKLLTSYFSIRTNDTTGLHVHIGNAAGTPDQTFDLRTVQNLASLVTLCESTIERMHPPWRVNNDFCSPPSTCFDYLDTHQYRFADKIDQTSSIDELTCLMAGGNVEGSDPDDMRPWFAYNFLQLRTYGYGTVEFRQHEGTVDVTRVRAWVLFCAGCVMWSSQAWLKGVPRLVERVLERDIELKVSDLLRELNLDYLVPFYERRLWSHQDNIEE